MISIHKTPSSRMHNNLPDETQLPNGQKFELLSLALLGVPSMAEKFLEVSNTMKQLQFDPADYICLKFIMLLNQAKIQVLNNRTHVQESSEQVHQILMEYCHNCYPQVPVSHHSTTTSFTKLLWRPTHCSSIQIIKHHLFGCVMQFDRWTFFNFLG